MAVPSLKRIYPFDSTEAHIFYFDVYGVSQQVFYNELEVKLSSDTSQVIYQERVESFLYQHTVPANTFINGEQYVVRVRTYNQLGVLLGESDEAFFFCFSPIQVEIPTIENGSVGDQNVTFRGTFYQAEGEVLENYQYRLYDENKNFLEMSPELYDGLLAYEFGGFANRTKYHIELLVMSTNKLSQTTGLIEFIARYEAPRFTSSLELENLPEEASVKVECNVIRLVGIPDIEPIDFTGGEADLRNNGIWFDEGFELKENFTIQMWLRDINEGSTFFKIIARDGSHLKLTYKNNQLFLRKMLNEEYIMQQLIETATIDSTENWFICIKHIGGLYDFECREVV